MYLSSQNHFTNTKRRHGFTCLTCLCAHVLYVPTYLLRAYVRAYSRDWCTLRECLPSCLCFLRAFLLSFFFKCLPFIKCFTPLHFFASLRILRAFSFLRALRSLIFWRALLAFIFLRALRVFIFLSVSNFSLYVLRDYFKAEYILHNMQYIIINNMTSRKYSTKPTFERRIL